MKRHEFVKYLKQLEGIDYIWGGNNPAKGFDCSGVIIYALQSCGELKRGFDTTAQGLHNMCKPVRDLKVGDLVFWGIDESRITHVMAYMGIGCVFGATGGNSSTTTQELAKRIGAKVCYKNIGYRTDLIAIGRFGFSDE